MSSSGLNSQNWPRIGHGTLKSRVSRFTSRSRHRLLKNERKIDYLGRFIIKLKQLADDYGLLMIVCAHPPKDGVDTAHWGNKADIGFCVWRNALTGPTLLHIDKLKDHETMGEPTLAELSLDKTLGRFELTRIGHEILQQS